MRPQQRPLKLENPVPAGAETPKKAPEKTYKRETAWVMGLFNAGMYVYGLWAVDDTAIDTARFLTPFTVASMGAALGADFTAKQGGR
jgi:hypothetical protein